MASTNKRNAPAPDLQGAGQRAKRKPALETVSVPVAAALLGKEPVTARRLIRDGQLRLTGNSKGGQRLELAQVVALRKKTWKLYELAAIRITRILEKATREVIIEKGKRAECAKK